MWSRLRPRSFYDVLAAIGCFVAISTGGAYAANTIGSGDVIDESLLSQDIKNANVKGVDLASDAITGPKVAPSAIGNTDLAPNAVGTGKILPGGVTASDVAADAVNGANVANDTLTGDDIVEGSLWRVPDSDRLDGLDSSSFVQGRGRLLSNRLVTPNDIPEPVLLLSIPDMGRIYADCVPGNAQVVYWNHSGHPVDVWTDYVASHEPDDRAHGQVIPDGGHAIVAESLPNNPSAADAASTLGVGIGNSPGPRAIATVNVFAFKSAATAPCGFQAQGNHWTSP